MVYILSNQQRTVFFIGMTGDLLDCVIAHKTGTTKRITCWQKCTRLVYYKRFREFNDGAKFLKAMEKEIYNWNFTRIHFSNPSWKDLTEKWLSPIELLSYKTLGEPLQCSDN